MFTTLNNNANVSAGTVISGRADRRKNKKHVRVYHQLVPSTPLGSSDNIYSHTGSEASNETVPQSQTSNRLGSESKSGQVHSFTPMPFNTHTIDTPISMLSPSISKGAESYNSPYVQPDFRSLSVHDMSSLVATQRWEDQLVYLTKSFETQFVAIPPLPTTQFYSFEKDGNCDPRLLALSMYNFPSDEKSRANTKLPLGLSVQPFANTIPNNPIPTIDMTDNTTHTTVIENTNTEPLRCKRCRAYLNPNFLFTYDSAVICNICKVKMTLPNEMVAPIGNNEKRTDYLLRPELYKSCVDFLVPQSYNVNGEQTSLPLHYIFMIDVSLPAVETDTTMSFIHAIKNSINYIRDNQPKSKIAIISYDKNIKFYKLNPTSETCQEYIITETEDCFLPFNNHFFVSTLQSRQIIDITLNQILLSIQQEKQFHTVDNCYGSALSAAKLAFDTFTGNQGGKIIASLSALPTSGLGNLKNKKDENSKKALKPDCAYYKDLSKKFVESFISLDLYVSASSFVDFSNAAYPAVATCGNIRHYPLHSYERCAAILSNDMMNNISIIKGYQAQLKLRVSDGISIKQYYLESNNNSDSDPIIPTVTSNTNIDILLKYSGKLKKDNDVNIQAALLYTDINGCRKVRVINNKVPVSQNPSDIFKHVNQNMIMRLMIHKYLSNIDELNYANLRKHILDDLSDIASQYKTYVSGNSSHQTIIADTLKTLPTFMLAFIKSRLTKAVTYNSMPNDHSVDYFKYFTFNQIELSYKLYPQIIPLHVPLSDGDLTFYDTNYKLLRVSASSLENITVKNSASQIVNGGAYLIFNGEIVYLWFNENTNRLLLNDLLGTGESIPIDQIHFKDHLLVKTNTKINKKVSQIMQNWCQLVNRKYIPLVPLRPNIDVYYYNVVSTLFVEDKTSNKIDSLNEFLSSIESQIKSKMANSHPLTGAAIENSDMTHQKFVQF